MLCFDTVPRSVSIIVPRNSLIGTGQFGILQDIEQNSESEVFAMRRSALGIVLLLVSVSTASAGTFGFGDEPYHLNWTNHSEARSGCLKWNWQQQSWYDHCPVYVHPWAYMHPGGRRHVVLRTKG
jgi:hypothetical protein